MLILIEIIMALKVPNKMKSYFPKGKDLVENRKWWLIDANDLVLGRMASTIASRLRGKHKAIMTPGTDCGDFIVVINSDKIHLTGNKLRDKIHYRHTGYPGGIRQRTMQERFERDSREIVTTAVRRMLPKESSLARTQMRRLKVFKDNIHNHAAQNPTPLNISSIAHKYRSQS